MKRITHLLFVATLVAALSHLSYGQTQTPSDEIRLRRIKAEQILHTVPSVQTILEETADQATGKFSAVATRTKEILPPDKESIVAEVQQKDGTNKKYYSIKIGDTLYMRSEDGEWQESDGREFSGPIAGAQVSTSYESLGEEKVSGLKVQVFKIRSTYSYGKGPSDSGNEATYFFDKIGQLRKTVIVTFDKLGPKRRITTQYSYPKQLQIEPPIK